jgi:hypothetical protein
VNTAGAAGKGLNVMQAEIKTSAVPRRVHLAAGMYFVPPGTPGSHSGIDTAFADMLIGGSNGRVHLEQFDFVPMPGAQSQKDLDLLVRALKAFNDRMPGSHADGVELVRCEGFPKGPPLQHGSAANIAGRFRLYKLMLAVAETDVILERHSQQNRRETLMIRLGLGAMLPTVMSGDETRIPGFLLA